MTLLALLVACADPESTDDSGGTAADDYVDDRVEDGDFDPLGDGAFELYGPDMIIEPGEDRMVCLFGTYEGDDIGIHQLITYQGAYGHHIIPMGTTASEIDFPDGTMVECSDQTQLSMADLEPLMNPTHGYVDGQDLNLGIDLAEGMAVKMDHGQRYVMQSHYVNSGTDRLRVRDVVVVDALAEDEVTTWAAPLILNNDAFSLPPGQASDVTFDCTIPDTYNVLYWTGHMHEWGTAFKLERLTGDTAETIYDVPTWDVSYRDAPPIDTYEPGEFELAAGTTLRTTCSYFNDTDEALEFPHEMCDSIAVIYPQLTTVICDNGELD